MTIERYPISAAVLAAVQTSGFPADLARKPDDGGWTLGSPPGPDSQFTPYTVVVPRSASSSDGPIADSSADWRLPYQLTSYGVNGEQVERLADRVRLAVAGMVKTSVTTDSGVYKVQKVGTDALGAVDRVDQTEPPFYVQTDTLVVWVSKEIT